MVEIKPISYLKLTNLHNALFIESNPGPVKYGLSLLGMCKESTRLPLAPIQKQTRLKVKESMIEAGLIN